MGETVLPHAVTPTVARTANVFAKGALVLLLVLALLFPDQGNLRDQAAGMRAVGYPLISFLLPPADPFPGPGRRGLLHVTHPGTWIVPISSSDWVQRSRQEE